MGSHQQALLGRCRFCGGDIDTTKTVYRAQPFAKDAKHAFLIDISSDDPQIHPPNVCNSCRLKLQRWRAIKNKTKKNDAIPMHPVEWQPHCEKCDICPKSTEPPVTENEKTPAEAAKEAANKLGIISWTESGATIFVKWMRGGLAVERHLIIHVDNSWTVTVNGSNISTSPVFNSIPKYLSTVVHACVLVTEVFGRKICTGNIGFDDVIAGRTALKGVHGELVGMVSQVADVSSNVPTATCLTVRHIKCHVFVEGDICAVCQSYRSTLFGSRNKQRAISANNLMSSSIRNDYLSPEQLNEKLNCAQKERRNLLNQNKGLRDHIKSLHEKEGVEIADDKQDELIQMAFQETQSELKQQIGDNAAFNLLYEEQIKAFEAKDSRQIRWHPAIIRFCISIYSKSSSAYNLIRNSPFMKLPHETTLKKYMQFTTPQVGTNPDVLEFLSNDWDIDSLPNFKRNVTLVFDEVKLKSGLVYSKSTGKLVGYTDLGPISNELESFEKRLKKHAEQQATTMEPEIATQMLVLMARGIFTPMRVPVAFFPSKSASCHQLYNCIWPTVRDLAFLGLTVRAFVSDGASWNRKFYALHSLSKTRGNVTYYTKHPFLRNERLYFICDVPHLMKTTRNNWENSGWNLKSRNLFYKGQPIKWTHLVDLWKWDRGDDRCSPGLRMMHRVGEAHIYLNPSLRMRVSLAAQVLSTTVANCMAVRGLHQTKSTEHFIRMMDKFFDCLNVKTRYQWIKAGNKPSLKPYEDANDDRFTWLLQEFLPWLDDWEKEAMEAPNLTVAERKKLCLSEQTLEGLRITVLSFVELTQDLLRDPDVDYLLSDKLNQDVLEEWFSLVRGAGGTNTNPTAKQLGDIHLNLLMAGSNAVASTRGNCRNQKRTIQLDDTPLPKKKRKSSTVIS